MRHRKVKGRLSRTYAERRALFANMLSSLFRYQRVRTTLAKAKYVKRQADRLVGLGKKKSVHARRMAYSILRDRDIVRLLFNEIAPRFDGRKGGYTRVVPADTRKGDGARMAFLELTELVIKEPPKRKHKKEKRPQEAAVPPKTEKAQEAPHKPEPVKGEKRREKPPVKKPHAFFRGIRKIFGRKEGGK